MDEKTKKLTYVGILTAGLAGLIAASVITIGGSNMFFGSTYTLSANFQNAEGLFVGSIVSLAGVRIGNVTKVSVHPDNPSVIVKMKLNQEFENRITSESVAQLKTMGVLGDKFVYIEPKNTGKTLTSGDMIAVLEAQDFMTSLNDRAPDLKYVSDILKSSAELMQSINRNDRAALLVENLKNTSENLNKLTGSPAAHQAMLHLSRVLKKLDEGDGTLGRLINDPSLYERLMDLTGASSRNRFLEPLIQNSIESSKSE